MRINFGIKKSIIFSFLLLVAGAFLFAQEEKTVISIDNAKTTRYEKAKDKNTDLIVLSGDVKISVSRGSTKNVISADMIRYDRASEMMYAEGNVSLEQTGTTDGGMNVSASSLMFNTATLEGVFDDGRVVQTKSGALNLPSGSKLVVASDIFGRSQQNTIAFKDGVLSFCGDEDPHWKIKASRIWLLPGGEFAFFNAFLFVGLVPVFYLPAFYYPKDELIFNPVFGYDQRRGYFIQSTFYLYGRKPLNTSSSSSSSSDEGTEKLKALFNFIKPTTLKEQVREGLVYHNLDEDFKGDTSNYFKIEGDYYANLGAMVGVDGVFKPKKIFNSLDANVKFGFSNTVFKDYSKLTYDPYASNGQRIYDSSNLLGFKMPFRYSGSLKFSISKPFTLSLSLPVYSDPYFNDDFGKREESMDWISFLMDSMNSNKEETSVNEISSFTWTLSSSYTVPLPDFFKPYVNGLSLSLNSSLQFSSRQTTDFSGAGIDSTVLNEWKNHTPQRKFYYPSTITPATLTGSLSGTLFEYNSSKGITKKSEPVPVFVTPLIEPDELLTEKEKAEKQKAEELALKAQETANGEEAVAVQEEKTPEEEKEILSKDSLPAISSPSVPSVITIGGINASVRYSVKPNLTSQLAYSSDKLEKPEDFKWENLKSSMYTFKLPVTLDDSFSYGGNFFTFSNNFSYNPVWQQHPYISKDQNVGGYTETSAKSLEKTDYAACKQDLTTTNSVSIKPFTNIPYFKDTGITYRNSIRLIRTEFLGDEFDSTGEAKWNYHGVDWNDSDSITTNALDLIFSSSQMEGKFAQNFTFTTVMKPQTEQYYGTLKLTFPYVTAGFETGFKKASSEPDAEWQKQPIKQSLSVSLLKNTLKITESLNYVLQETDSVPAHWDSFKASLSWKNLSASYVMSYTTGYDMTYTEAGLPDGWKAKSEKEFQPSSLTLSYSLGSKTLYTWKNRVSMSLNFSTNVTADLLRPTSSSFNFSPTISFKVQDFLTFSFSSTSKNSVIYRYFGNKYGIGGETNPLLDLWNGFRFDNDDIRKASGFKLKSLNFSLTHELHDWDFSTSFKIEPRLITGDDGKKSYDFSPYMTIAISWKPMSSMKTEILDKYGEWSLQ